MIRNSADKNGYAIAHNTKCCGFFSGHILDIRYNLAIESVTFYMDVYLDGCIHKGPLGGHILDP